MTREVAHAIAVSAQSLGHELTFEESVEPEAGFLVCGSLQALLQGIALAAHGTPDIHEMVEELKRSSVFDSTFGPVVIFLGEEGGISSGNS